MNLKLAIIENGCLFLAREDTKEKKHKKDKTMNNDVMKLVGAVMLVCCFAGCGQVDTGEAGFFTRWGKITSREPLSDGLHFYEPFGTDLVTYNIKNQVRVIETEVFTKDVQQMQLRMSITYNLSKSSIMELHAKTGRNYEQILIHPAVLGAAKDAIGKLEADEIIYKREAVTKTIEDRLRAEMTGYGINITFVKLLNIEYSDAYERAVEAKQVALQNSIKERNETARLKEVANQQVVKAEAEAKAKVVNSKADAEAILIKAESEAQAIKMKNDALASSASLIEYTLAQRWDGKLPDQMLGNTPVPFINVMPKSTTGGK